MNNILDIALTQPCVRARGVLLQRAENIHSVFEVTAAFLALGSVNSSPSLTAVWKIWRHSSIEVSIDLRLSQCGSSSV